MTIILNRKANKKFISSLTALGALVLTSPFAIVSSAIVNANTLPVKQVVKTKEPKKVTSTLTNIIKINKIKTSSPFSRGSLGKSLTKAKKEAPKYFKQEQVEEEQAEKEAQSLERQKQEEQAQRASEQAQKQAEVQQQAEQQNEQQTSSQAQQSPAPAQSGRTMKVTFYDPAVLGAVTMPGGLYSGVAADLSIFPKGTVLRITLQDGTTMVRTVNDSGEFVHQIGGFNQLDIAMPNSSIPSWGTGTATVEVIG